MAKNYSARGEALAGIQAGAEADRIEEEERLLKIAQEDAQRSMEKEQTHRGLWGGWGKTLGSLAGRWGAGLLGASLFSPVGWGLAGAALLTGVGAGTGSYIGNKTGRDAAGKGYKVPADLTIKGGIQEGLFHTGARKALKAGELDIEKGLRTAWRDAEDLARDKMWGGALTDFALAGAGKYVQGMKIAKTAKAVGVNPSSLSGFSMPEFSSYEGGALSSAQDLWRDWRSSSNLLSRYLNSKEGDI